MPCTRHWSKPWTRCRRAAPSPPLFRETSRARSTCAQSSPDVPRIFDLSPMLTPARAVRPIQTLRDNSFESERAGVAEHRLAVLAFHVLGVDQRRAGLAQELFEERPA